MGHLFAGLTGVQMNPGLTRLVPFGQTQIFSTKLVSPGQVQTPFTIVWLPEQAKEHGNLNTVYFMF